LVPELVEGLFIPFPFAFYLLPRNEKQKITMHNHPKITAATQVGSCPFKSTASNKAVPLSKFAFQRYLKPSNLHFQAGPGINVYELPCGCSVWSFKSGGRYITALPVWPGNN